MIKLHQEILTPAITWMDLKDTVLSEVSQTQKARYCLIPHEVPGVARSIETGRRVVGAGVEWGQFLFHEGLSRWC